MSPRIDTWRMSCRRRTLRRDNAGVALNPRSERRNGGRPAFLDHPIVQTYVSLRAFGLAARHLDAVIAEIRTRTQPGANILCLATAAQERERRLAEALPDRTLSVQLPASVASAPLPPDSLDAVTALWSLSSAPDLEQVWQRIRVALRPGGAILVQDRVGERHPVWHEAQIEAANRALRELPAAHKVHHATIDAVIMAAVAADNAHLARPDEILTTCTAAGFEIAGYASGGCALLQPALLGQMHTFAPDNWDHNAALATLFRAEARAMDAGLLGDAIAMFVAIRPATD